MVLKIRRLHLPANPLIEMVLIISQRSRCRITEGKPAAWHFGLRLFLWIKGAMDLWSLRCHSTLLVGCSIDMLKQKPGHVLPLSRHGVNDFPLRPCTALANPALHWNLLLVQMPLWKRNHLPAKCHKWLAKAKTQHHTSTPGTIETRSKFSTTDKNYQKLTQTNPPVNTRWHKWRKKTKSQARSAMISQARSAMAPTVPPPQSSCIDCDKCAKMM